MGILMICRCHRRTRVALVTALFLWVTLWLLSFRVDNWLTRHTTESMTLDPSQTKGTDRLADNFKQLDSGIISSKNDQQVKYFCDLIKYGNTNNKEEVKNTEQVPGGPSLLVSQVDSKITFNIKNNIGQSNAGATKSQQLTQKSAQHYDASSLVTWSQQMTPVCGAELEGYINEFALLSEVIVNKQLATAPRLGGEQINDVINQPEQDEYFTYKKGFFEILKCQSLSTYVFNQRNHLNSWMESVIPSKDKTSAESRSKSCTDFTIAVARYEYANLFHTMTDWYNVFLMMAFFKKTAAETSILIMDAHPIGALDPVWSRLFGSVVRLKDLPPKTHFDRLVWATMGYNSPMKIYVTPQAPPLYEGFHSFFLSGYDLDVPKRRMDCEKLSILFIWRRDYVAHPRNPTGHVWRQIANEAELESDIQKRYPSYTVRGAQIDSFDMAQQLKLVTGADILIGMHGAGLTHALFLAYGAAGLIELRPSYATSSGDHFRAIAQWRGLVYESWSNIYPKNELAGHATIIPVAVMNKLLQRTISKLCPSVERSPSPAVTPPL